MLESLHVVEHENPPISGRETVDGTLQGDSVHRPRQMPIDASILLSGPLIPRGVGLLQGNHVQPLLSEVHKHHIHHQPMQPSAECRLAPKAANLAEKLKKRLLREVFSPARVADHPQAKRENPPFMGFVKLLESSLIALLGFPDEFCYSLPLIGRLRRCARFRTQVVIAAAASPPMDEMRGLVLELSKFA